MRFYYLKASGYTLYWLSRRAISIQAKTAKKYNIDLKCLYYS